MQLTEFAITINNLANKQIASIRSSDQRSDWLSRQMRFRLWSYSHCRLDFSNFCEHLSSSVDYGLRAVCDSNYNSVFLEQYRKDLHISGRFRRATPNSSKIGGRVTGRSRDTLAQERLCSLNMRKSFLALLKNIFLAK